MAIYKLYEGLEDNFQISVANLLNLSGMLWHHAAGERKTKISTDRNGRRYTVQGGMLKRKGVKAGAPDVIIMEPKGDYHGMAVELKARTNKMTDEQYEFLSRLNQNGYFTFPCWSLDEFIYYLDLYKKLGGMTTGIHYQEPTYVNLKGNYYQIVGLGIAYKKKALQRI